LVLVKEKVIQI